MNRETLTKSAALRALGLLDGDALRSFETELRESPAARAALQHFQQAARESASFPAAESSAPNAEPRLLSRGDEASPEPDVASVSPERLWLRWLGWGLAACFALASAWLAFDRSARADRDARADAIAAAAATERVARVAEQSR